MRNIVLPKKEFLTIESLSQVKVLSYLLFIINGLTNQEIKNNG